MCRYQIPKVSAFAAVQGCAIFAQLTVFVVGAAVLVVQMIGVLPNIVAKQSAFVDHWWGILVRCLAAKINRWLATDIKL